MCKCINRVNDDTFTVQSVTQGANGSISTNCATVTYTPTADYNGSDSYDVYFGTSAPGALQGNQTGTTFSPGILTASLVYYWRVDSVNANRNNEGAYIDNVVVSGS